MSATIKFTNGCTMRHFMTNYDSLNSGKRADALEKALLLSVEHYFKTFDCCDICPLGVIDCDDERGEMISPMTHTA